MNCFSLLLLFISPFISNAQYINCRVTDAETNQPLYYATIYYGKQPAITFSDSLGNFFIRPEVLKEKDSVTIEFIGYKTLTVFNKEIAENKIFNLYKSSNHLQDVLIKNCNQYEEKIINYNYGKLDSYWTVIPNTRVSYLSYYPNNEEQEGYVTQILFHTPSSFLHKQDFSTPLRIRWYEWDSITQLPGKELTTTSIVVNAYKNGINKISITDKTLFFGKEGIVIGIEFLYPQKLEKEYYQLTTEKERFEWTLKYEWSIGTIINKNSCEGFVQTNTNGIRRFITAKGFLKIALQFKINACKN